MNNQYLDCYTRVSTGKQRTEGNSLAVQEELGKKVANKLGLEFRHYQEGSRSSTTQYRDVLEQLKYDIISGKVKNIWIQDRSRMFRDMLDGLMFRSHFLEKYKIILYEGETAQKISFDNEDEMVMYDIITRLQQYENKKRSEKSQRGKRHKLVYESKSKPVYLGGTPLFGYESKDKLWTVNNKESKWVKYIFDAYEKGKSTIEIKHHLDKEGVEPRRTENGLWNVATLQKMLKNKTYTGLHKINKYEKVSKEEYFENREQKPELYVMSGRVFKKVIGEYSYKVPKIINVIFLPLDLVTLLVVQVVY